MQSIAFLSRLRSFAELFLGQRPLSIFRIPCVARPQLRVARIFPSRYTPSCMAMAPISIPGCRTKSAWNWFKIGFRLVPVRSFASLKLSLFPDEPFTACDRRMCLLPRSWSLSLDPKSPIPPCLGEDAWGCVWILSDDRNGGIGIHISLRWPPTWESGVRTHGLTLELLSPRRRRGNCLLIRHRHHAAALLSSPSCGDTSRCQQVRRLHSVRERLHRHRKWRQQLPRRRTALWHGQAGP